MNWGQLYETLLSTVAYIFILASGAKVLAKGADLLLEVPGIPVVWVGGILIPILGAVPDAAIVLVAVLHGTATDNDETSIGSLVGSTLMLIAFSISVILLLGRCDIRTDTMGRPHMVSGTLTRRWDLLRTGVVPQSDVRVTAWIALACLGTFLVIQVPAWFEPTHQAQFPCLIICAVVCLITMAVYFFLTIRNDRTRARIEDEARRQHDVNTVVQTFRRLQQEAGVANLSERFHVPGSQAPNVHFDAPAPARHTARDHTERSPLLADDDSADEIEAAGHATRAAAAVAAEVSAYDLNADTYSAPATLSVLPSILRTDGHLDRFMENPEVFACLASEPELLERTRAIADRVAAGELQQPADVEHAVAEAAAEAFNLALEAKTYLDGDEAKQRMDRWSLLGKAVALIVFGFIIVTMYSDPVVDCIEDMATVLGVPSFVTAFFMTPIASNAMELTSSAYFALRKDPANISTSLTALLGSTAMNNTLVLGVLVIAKLFDDDFVWVFTAETLALIIVFIYICTTLALKKVITTLDAVLFMGAYVLSFVWITFLAPVMDKSV